MRKKGKVAAFVAAAAVVAGVAAPTAAAAAATGRDLAGPPASVAFSPGSGQSVVDWNHELITILGTPGAQPATVHPTRSFAILQAAEYDAVVSITHAAPPYLFSVPAPRGARPDAAADQAAHDVLAAFTPRRRAGSTRYSPGNSPPSPTPLASSRASRWGPASPNCS
jgi:hypothetical protein